MLTNTRVLAALGMGLVVLFGYAGTSRAQNAVTAIDIALEPDVTMIQHAQADNARLLKVFPKGFALDETHHPHISMLQQFSTENGRDIQKFLLNYVANFVQIAAGKKFNPHVTIGVGTIPYLKKMLAEPFGAFTFSPAGASVYQLGSFGTAQRNSRLWS